MPEISRFLGIVIFMLYDDHAPAHFHAAYGDYRISMNIETGVVEGKFPRKAQNAVRKWYLLHKDELVEDWYLARKHAELKKIAPLEQ
jgi:hypothetical protein